MSTVVAPRPRKVNLTKVAGTALVGAWLAAIVGIVLYLISAWDRDLFDEYAPRYLDGLAVTLELLSLCIVFGFLVAVPLTWLRMSKNRILSGLAAGYISLFQGTPLLAQIFLVYYGVSSFDGVFQIPVIGDIFRSAFACAVVTFALNTAAFQSEIFRGAIESVPNGQWESSASLGLHGTVTLWKIIIPHATPVALRPFFNEVILMLKSSSLVAIITVFDLMGVTRVAYSETYDFQAYVWAALIYVALVEVLRLATNRIEQRITKHLRRLP